MRRPNPHWWIGTAIFIVIGWALDLQGAQAHQQKAVMQVAEAADDGETCSNYLPTIGRTVRVPCETGKKPEPSRSVPPHKALDATQETVPPQRPAREIGKAFMEAGYSTKFNGTIAQCEHDCETDPKCKAFQFTSAAWTTCSLYSRPAAETVPSPGAIIGRR